MDGAVHWAKNFNMASTVTAANMVAVTPHGWMYGWLLQLPSQANKLQSHLFYEESVDGVDCVSVSVDVKKLEIQNEKEMFVVN